MSAAHASPMQKNVKKASKLLLGVIGIITPVLLACIFLFGTFATISSQDKAEARMQKYVDDRVAAQQATIVEMKGTLDRIDDRVFELYKERRVYGTHQAGRH
jgi:hypothetical protein